jgi:nucleoid DNA-binding protein
LPSLIFDIREIQMNKTDLIDEIAKVAGTKKMAADVLNCMLSAIAGSLEKKDAVSIAGFGTFKTTERKARTGRNPQTGKEIKIKASTSVRFVPGKALKDSVN